MAIDGQKTFGDIGGAVSDLFAGFGAKTGADLKAKGLGIEAEGTGIQAQSLLLKMQGDIAEGKEYGLAADLARANEQYTALSTSIQQKQLDRSITQTIGGAQAGFAGAGLKESGSALDVLRDSANQGALAKNVLAMQGQITEAGYEEQAKSYDLMSKTAQDTAAGESAIAAQMKNIQTEQEGIAQETKQAGQDAAFGDFLGGAIKSVAAVATLFG